MNGIEQQIRGRLGVPPTAKYVLIIDQSAHMDWDWTSTFMQYFSRTDLWSPPTPTGVDQLLTEALDLLSRNASPRAKAPNLYYYSLCEIGYFQKFVQTQIARGIEIVPKIRAAGQYLRIVGGGITSPDCLLSSGEAFLRNYLLGNLWLAHNLPELLPLKHCWLPDDFGQDPELPVAVQALGMTSIGFSRLPGIPPPPGVQQQELEIQLLTSGADFLWASSDNASIVYTHWMPGPVPGYYQGSGLAKSGGAQKQVVQAIQSFLAYNNKDLTTYTPPFSAAPTNYLYMPIDDDFMYPVKDLLDCVNTWNSSGQTGGVYAVVASYDDFVSLVQASGTSLTSMAYNGTPYWTGYYASRPELKILHHSATRELLAAEVFGLLASGSIASAQDGVLLDPLFWERLSHAWIDFVPSTHHDYICGTAPDAITELEQLPLLRTAYAEAEGVTEQALRALAASVDANADEVVIVNPAGIPFTGLVELQAPVPAGMNSINIAATMNPVQPTFEGGLVFAAQVSSMGYTTGTLSSQIASGPSTATISPAGGGAVAYTLQNQWLTVVVSAESNWGISSILDVSGKSLLASGCTGNDLVFYVDEGNLYQFGNEIPGTIASAFIPAPLSIETSGAGLGPTVLESGPLRVRLKTVVSIAIEGTTLPTQTYTREYCLAAGEPFLRMTTTGAAPDVGATVQTGYSVMAAFPLAHPVSSISHGTPFHWTNAQPYAFWTPPIFRPTHGFLLPAAGGEVLAGIYHPEVLAWGYDLFGVLLGCLLRNTPNQGRGAAGSDPSVHTLHYAFRVPSGLGGPSTGQPLSEAVSYAAPPRARMVSPLAMTGSQALSRSGFIASVSRPGIIQAAKFGDVDNGALILRIYQPSNSPQTLTVTLGRGQPATVSAVTALEDPITSGATNIQITATGFTIQVATALNTVQISFAALSSPYPSAA